VFRLRGAWEGFEPGFAFPLLLTLVGAMVDVSLWNVGVCGEVALTAHADGLRPSDRGTFHVRCVDERIGETMCEWIAVGVGIACRIAVRAHVVRTRAPMRAMGNRLVLAWYAK
jgi:hypothetical protein